MGVGMAGVRMELGGGGMGGCSLRGRMLRGVGVLVRWVGWEVCLGGWEVLVVRLVWRRCLCEGKPGLEMEF